MPTSNRVAALERSVLEGPAKTSQDARSVAFGTGSSEDLRDYLNKVRVESYRLTDRDVDDLRAAGLDEDTIFELTVAAATGAAGRLLAAGLRIVNGPE